MYFEKETIYAKNWKLKKKAYLNKEAQIIKELKEEKKHNNMPITIDIEVTNKCNLKCNFCARTILNYDKSTKYNTGYMSFKLFKKIIDEISKKDTLSIRLAWYGEPLLHPNIIEMIKYAKNAGISDVGISTNGLLLDENIATKIVLSNLDRITISIDSHISSVYNTLRINSNFEVVVNNLIKLKKIRDKYNSNLLIRVGKISLNDENFNNTFFNKFIKISDIVSISPLIKEKRKKIIDSSINCPFIWFSCVISWDGYIFPCTIDSKRIMKMGNLNTESIESIWNNYKYNMLRYQHKKHDLRKLEVCSKCSLFTKETFRT